VRANSASCREAGGIRAISAESPVRAIAARGPAGVNGGPIPDLRSMPMFSRILVFGVIAGLIAGGVLSAAVLGASGHGSFEHGMLFGYTTMLVALSFVFVGIKRHRDLDRGGVIGFLPAFGMGLGISVIAGVLYALSWEAALAITHVDFASSYAAFALEQERARGASAEALATLAAQLDEFKVQYANPLFRLPMTFVEIFPVGVLVSLVSAALLRNPRFLPARAANATPAA
jgi:hypothetical protein